MKIGNLEWDKTSEHFYHTGVDAVALYVDDGNGWYGAPVAWSGVTAINENPSGAEETKIYADNINYLSLISKEEFAFSIEAYQSPEDFDVCDGSASITAALKGILKVHGQARKRFGLVYRELVGSDTAEPGSDIMTTTGGTTTQTGANYIYHAIYGARASVSARDHATVNDTPEAVTMSWDCTTTPITDSDDLDGLTGVKELAHMEIDCRNLAGDDIDALEALFFGTSSSAATAMPTPAEIYTAIA